MCAWSACSSCFSLPNASFRYWTSFASRAFRSFISGVLLPSACGCCLRTRAVLLLLAVTRLPPGPGLGVRRRGQDQLRGQAETSRLLAAGDQPETARPRLRVPRCRRRPRGVAGGARPDPRARDPAGVDRRLDLRGPERAPAGDRHRRRGTEAVPLPRAVARAARPAEVRQDAGLRAHPATTP